MTAKRHHYIPQCYLKGFAPNRNKPKLFVVDGKERRSFRTKPANIAAEQYFHRIDSETLAPDAIEGALAAFEGELGPALERVITRRALDDENDRAYLLNLMCLVAIKNPRHRENFRSFHEQITKRIMEVALATPERWASQMRRAKEAGYIQPDSDTDYEKMRDFVRRGEYAIKTTTGYHLSLELAAFNEVLPFFFKRQWILLRAPPGRTGFITSDHPICLMWSEPGQRRRFHPAGHGMRRTQVVFPVSNELAVIGAFEVREAAFSANERLIAEVNGTIIEYAERQVYARDSDFIYKMAHNEKIMRGTELLIDQARQHKSNKAVKDWDASPDCREI